MMSPSFLMTACLSVNIPMTPKKKEEAFPIKAVANRVAAIPVEEAPM